MRGMHIKGHPRRALLADQTNFPKRGKSAREGRAGGGATVTSHEMPADNTYEGDARIGPASTDRIDYASMWTAKSIAMDRNMFLIDPAVTVQRQQSDGGGL